MKVVIASDSFKGSLTSAEVARAAEEGIKSLDETIETVAVDVADGGEGLVDALVHSLGGELITAVVSDPLSRPVPARYGVTNIHGEKTAIIEMAAASGLPLLKKEEYNPLKTNTFGTGELILDALERGCRKFLVGIGGSATNDGGMGMLRALGWRFLDRDGNELEGNGSSLSAVGHIDGSGADQRLKGAEFTIACDVRNPFCGPQGAAYVFSPQKGADPKMVERLDHGLLHLSGLIECETGIDIRQIEGAGAAGGLGGAFKAFLNSELRSGIEIVLDAICFDTLIKDADIVITGEGRIDAQTPSGKTAAGVLRHCRAAGIPCMAIGGKIEMCPELAEAGFAGIFPVVDGPCSLEEAMKSTAAKQNISRTVRQLISLTRIIQDFSGSCRTIL